MAYNGERESKEARWCNSSGSRQRGIPLQHLADRRVSVGRRDYPIGTMFHAVVQSDAYRTVVFNPPLALLSWFA
jgi:hypothetical protein